MPKTYRAYVDNIGQIGGDHRSLIKAVKEVKDTIAKSARADNHGYVIEEPRGEIVFEIGESSND